MISARTRARTKTAAADRSRVGGRASPSIAALRWGLLSQPSLRSFNEGDLAGAVRVFSSDVTFVAPGKSAVAGVYDGREGVATFFSRLHELSGSSLRIALEDVIANDDRMILFLRFTAKRENHDLDVVVAGFHDDLAEDGWRKATFLPDDLAAFDRFFQPI
jgi:ketosteroid isomerase-like protein